MTKVFRRTFTLLLVIALLAAMPLSAFAASKTTNVTYSGYTYTCYSQCTSASASASTSTQCSTSTVRVRARAVQLNGAVWDKQSGFVAYTASLSNSSLVNVLTSTSWHWVKDVDGTTLLSEQSVTNN